MRIEKNILIAFILNLAFSIFEFIGGTISGSVAIISDAIHDIGDAVSIGFSYFLERKSKKGPDDMHTYGYKRYSVLASFITTVVLLFGSTAVIYNAICRIINPVDINYSEMIVFAVIGTLVNSVAAIVTKDGDSLNQKAVNLHMLEDVLGWVIVLIGAIIMKFTHWAALDPIMSIGVAVFIFVNSITNLKSIGNIFVEKIPSSITIKKITDSLLTIEGVIDVHHIHIWSIDGYHNYGTMHIVTDDEQSKIKDMVRKKLEELNIVHVTLELENSAEKCLYEKCSHVHNDYQGCHHHHHH